MAKTMKPKPQRKAKKPGPREERLVITEDPKEALARLFKKTN